MIFFYVASYITFVVQQRQDPKASYWQPSQRPEMEGREKVEIGEE